MHASGGLLNLARADASGADEKGLVGAVYNGSHAAQVGIPASPGHVMRVADAIAMHGTFSADVTGTSHCSTSSDCSFDLAANFHSITNPAAPVPGTSPSNSSRASVP